MRALRARRPVALTALLLAATGSVWATGNLELLTQGGTRIGTIRWQPASLPVVWKSHDPTTIPGCYSSTHAPPATLQPEQLAAFAIWQDEPDSGIAFTYGGTTSVQDVGGDGTNLVTFCDSTVLANDFGGFLGQAVWSVLTVETTITAGGGCPPGQGLLPAPLGFCFPVGIHPAGTLLDADIRYNSFGTREEAYATDGAIGGLDPSTQLYDLRSIAAHEAGHVAGLSHDPLPQATMLWFAQPNPPADGLGSHVLDRTDKSTIGRYYPEASYGTAFGTITGRVTLDGVNADGVHVVAIDPATMLAVAGRFSLTRFADPNGFGPEGPDARFGTGFYRIDGLPPGSYYVYAEYFDNSDLPLFPGRLSQRYNRTVANSNVAPGSGSAGALGFLPTLTEFYDAAESAEGGDGVSPGAAADNSDAASLVAVTAGAITANIDIAINIEPTNGQTPAQRQNPTTRSTILNHSLQAGDIIWNFFLDGGGDDYYAVRFPAALLPAPPYNVAEGLWIHAGLATIPMVTSLAFADPGAPAIPDVDHPVVASAGRVLAGGRDGALDGHFLTNIRDQWNVTVNEPRDLFLIVHQPDPPPGAETFPEAAFALLTCSNASCTTPARVGRTLVTENGGATWSALANADVFYDLVVEQDPPVMITGAVPAQMPAGQTGDIVLQGFGFRTGAAVDFGADITVNSVLWLSAQQLQANVTITDTGASEPRSVDVTVTNPSIVFPNVARVFTVQPVADSDGDGTPNAADCAPLDGTVESPASEVAGLQVLQTAGPAQVSWTSQDGAAGSATDYDVVAGDLGALRASGTYAAALCAVDDHADTPFLDAAVVGSGEGRYWLVRACNGCNLSGCTFGDGSGVTDPRDALDVSSPCP